MKTYLLCLLLMVVGCETNYYNEKTDENLDMEKFLTAVTSIVSKTQQSNQKLQTPQMPAGNYTVEFSVTNIQPVPPAVTIGNINPIATISFAIGGVHYERKISVFNGASITGVAEDVIVRVFDETDPADPTNQTSYDVSMSVGRGVRGSVSQPPIYQQYITQPIGGLPILGYVAVAAGGNVTIPIPQDIGINSVMVTSEILGVPTPGSQENNVVQGNTGAVAVKVYNPNLYGFVPINPQATTLSLFNNDTGVVAAFSVTWGIDG